VLGHRHAELDAALPQRLIVIGAVESDRITIPGGLLPIDSFRCAWNRPLLVSAQHDRLETTLLDRVFQLLKGFVRRLTRENRYGRKSFCIRREHVGRHHVVGADCGPVQIGMGYPVDGETEARIDQREVDAQLGQALVQQGRQQRRGLVVGIARHTPPDGAT